MHVESCDFNFNALNDRTELTNASYKRQKSIESFFILPSNGTEYILLRVANCSTLVINECERISTTCTRNQILRILK